MELYVHIPFCKQKCRYCSFTSFAAQESRLEKYVDLLIREAELRRPEVKEPVRTVYIGGGTPSLMSPALLRNLVTGLSDQFCLDSVEEFSVEANPGTVTQEWLDTAVALGISRISFGMQALQDRLLQMLGRIHRFGAVAESVRLARAAGFDNISLDLMFGLPGQTMEDWKETVDASLSLRPSHLSAYGLIPEEGTPLYRDLEAGILTLPDPEEEREMYDLVIRETASAGFHQYEISSFARENRECMHNIGYWTQVPYLGLGVSAASMDGIAFTPDGMTYYRSVNPDRLDTYEKKIDKGFPFPSGEKIGPREARFETVMLGLRMNRGISDEVFARKHGVTPEHCWGEKLHEMEKRGLIVHENASWRLTARGFDIQNTVLVELMDD